MQLMDVFLLMFQDSWVFSDGDGNRFISLTLVPSGTSNAWPACGVLVLKGKEQLSAEMKIPSSTHPLCDGKFLGSQNISGASSETTLQYSPKRLTKAVPVL